MSSFDIEKAVGFMEQYINTYRQQPYYKEYTEATFINDMLYGVGVAVSGEHRFAQGFDTFKEKLKEDYL